MNNLCDLFAGANINNQHPYFDMAKKDIIKLSDLYSRFEEYDNSEMSLIQYIISVEPDLYQLNIVTQYIITYGKELGLLYLQDKKIDTYNNIKYEEYFERYIEDLTLFIR
jgi:hypothetical protein